jgi:hypothetical protein
MIQWAWRAVAFDGPARQAGQPGPLLGVVAADDWASTQRAHALRGRRRRHVPRGGEIAVRLPRVVLELPEEGVVELIKLRHVGLG